MDLPESVAGADGPQEIAEKLKEVYEVLYNSVDTSEAVDVIKNSLKNIIGQDSIAEVSKIIPEIVKKAATKMKPNNSDVTGYYTSDLLLHSPDSVFAALAEIFSSIGAL